MQEEVENRTLTLVVSGTKFTGRLLKAAITKYLAHRKEKKLQKQKSRDTPVIPHGKQTVKQLIGQNQGVSNIEITDPSIKEFEKIARKYGVDYAVKKGYRQIVLIGGLSGRLDHTLSNLAILEDLEAKKLRGMITDGMNRVRFLRNDSVIIPKSKHFRYLSLIAADEKVKGVEIDGCKYPLKNAKLSRPFQYAVSNEVKGNCALISVRKGAIYVIESR